MCTCVASILWFSANDNECAQKCKQVQTETNDNNNKEEKKKK